MFGVFQIDENLISLVTLDSNGCKYTAEGGVQGVIEEAIVVMKEEEVNSLYLLQDIIVKGVVAVP